MIRGIVSLTIIVVALAWTWKSLTVRPWFLTTDWAADYKSWEARRLRPDQVGFGIVLAETDDPCYKLETERGRVLSCGLTREVPSIHLCRAPAGLA